MRGSKRQRERQGRAGIQCGIYLLGLYLCSVSKTDIGYTKLCHLLDLEGS